MPHVLSDLEEILHEPRERSSGLNAGRWDYLFSLIKTFGHRTDFLLPDRAKVTRTAPFMRAYTELLVRMRTCHKRSAHAIGGMAAHIALPLPADRNSERKANALLTPFLLQGLPVNFMYDHPEPPVASPLPRTRKDVALHSHRASWDATGPPVSASGPSRSLPELPGPPQPPPPQGCPDQDPGHFRTSPRQGSAATAVFAGQHGCSCCTTSRPRTSFAATRRRSWASSDGTARTRRARGFSPGPCAVRRGPPSAVAGARRPAWAVARPEARDRVRLAAGACCRT
ncbi:hypothetical protein GCM10010273_13530 [Streptomyces lavendulocolor]